MFSFENCANLASQSTVAWNIKLWLETPNKKILNGWWLPEESLSLSRDLPLETVSWGTPFPRFEAWSSPTRELRDFQSLTFRRCGRCRRWGPTSFAVETKRFPSKRPSQQCPKIILARFYKPSLKPLLEPVNSVTRLGDFWKFLTEFLAKGAKIFMTIWALFKSTIF